MSIGEVVEVLCETFTGPLKIPQPKNSVKFSLNHANNDQNNANCTNNIVSTSTTTSTSFSLPKNKIMNCDSPQIFSIESRAESRGLKSTIAGVSGISVDSVSGIITASSVKGSCVADKNTEKGDTQMGNTQRGDSNDFGGYREVGTSSGFNSDLDSDSPFYSSDIDSDSSSEPPILWNFADYFANLPGNDWCVRIPQCFIDDEFNLFELPDVFCCSLILTDEPCSKEKEEFKEYGFDDLIDFITIEDLTGTQCTYFIF